jgi:hypothetical protein
LSSGKKRTALVVQSLTGHSRLRLALTGIGIAKHSHILAYFLLQPAQGI